MKKRKLTERLNRKPYGAQRVLDICYHEAGHIVAALKFNLGILSGVKVSRYDRGTRRRGGRQVWGGRVLTERTGTLEQVAVFAQAGYASEKRFNARPTDYGNLSLDQNLFMESLGVEGGQYLCEWDKCMNSKTLPFVQSNWRFIAAIAQGLIRQRHHTLSKQRIIGLYEAVTLRYPAKVAVHEAAHVVMSEGGWPRCR